MVNFTKLGFRLARPGDQCLDQRNTDFETSTDSSRKMGKITHLTETVETRKSVFGQRNTDFEISTVSSQKGRFDQDIQDTKTNFGSLERLEIREDKFASLVNIKSKFHKTN